MHAPQRPPTDATRSDADSQTILLHGVSAPRSSRSSPPTSRASWTRWRSWDRPRYRGFLTSIDALVERQPAYLTDVDHREYEALGAIEPQTGGVVGVAQFMRMAPDVAAAGHSGGRPLGSGADSVALLERLADRARAEGLARFTGVVLAENHDVIRLVEQLGDGTLEFSGSESHLEVVLPERACSESALRGLLRAGVAGLLAPARLFMAARGQPGDG